MTTVTVKNNASSPRKLNWLVIGPPLPTILKSLVPPDAHVERHGVNIKPGETAQVPADVWADKSKNDPVVRGWVAQGDLALVQS